MCGIAGLIPLRRHPAPAPDEVPALFRLCACRGPDDRGVLVAGPSGVRTGREYLPTAEPADAVLLHLRLAIIDVSELGWQPMATPDGRYHLVFNGEIYNYVELREELRGLGHCFRSQSDTEVLLAAFAEWGPAALSRLTGMFAIALLDSHRRTLLLARDPFGIKPLYYATGAGGFAFASESRVLRALPWVSRRVNPARVFAYLRYGMTDFGAETLLDAVRQLPGGHYMEVPLDSPARAEPVRYWSLEIGPAAELSFADAAERLRSLFLDSIRLHLRSDVPVGTALSGGVDSSAIVAGMRHVAGPALDLHTFSYIAADAAVSEERWADLVDAATGATMHKVRLEPSDLLGDLERLIGAQDEPFGSTGIYAQYRVFQLAHEAGVKVLLDGQGADELLGGYRYHVAARLASMLRRGRLDQAVAFGRRVASAPGLGHQHLAYEALAFLLPPAVQEAMRGALRRESAPAWLDRAWFEARGVTLRSPNFSRGGPDLLRHNLHHTLVDTSLPALLRYEDRNSMAFSVESRVPFLTPDIARFVLSLPEEHLIGRDGTTKAVFREAMRGIVPDTVLDRRDKVGFATPEQAWMLALQPWVDRTIASDMAAAIPAFRPAEMRAEWDLIRRGERAFDSRVWRWCNLVEWVRQAGVTFS
jgi:asparagine synthase (glutamine-hydrolysing)